LEQLIYLELDDDLTTIRDKLEHAKAKRVVLVLPDRFKVLANQINCKLLRRYASNLALELALVTTDGATRSFARAAGLAVYSSVDRGKEEAAPPEPIREETRLAAAARPPRPPRAVTPISQPLLTNQVLLALATLLVLLVLSGALGLFLLPSAEVVVSPASEPILETLAVKASVDFKEASLDKLELPARMVGVALEDSAQTDTTGKKFIPDKKAKGTVVFVNKSLAPVSVPAGTVVSTSSGDRVRFQTLAPANLQAVVWDKARVEVEAVEPGKAGNVPRGTINLVEGPLAVVVGVTNDEDAKGGDDKQVRYVTKEDRARLRDSLTEKLKAAGTEAIRANVKKEDLLLAPTITVTVRRPGDYDKDLDQVADRVSLSRMQVEVSGLVVSGGELAKMARQLLKSKVKAGYALVPEEIDFKGPANVKFEGGVASFQLTVAGSQRAEISPGQVLAAVRGKTVEAATETLLGSFKLNREPQITLERGFLGRLPLFDFRILVTVLEQ